ncbi:MAG: 3-oxoacyl-ACP reductase FabG [Clostridiales bacterium]|jgi:3-oxoacyl-[acyl-carrier protein] reductase|nr:3-oxoacyl-ACP reductase FabG [Clostridiales bacterium]
MNDKKTVLVTGASRGIGREIARVFSLNGYNVIINYYKSKDLAESLKSEIKTSGGEAEIFCCDVADENAVKQMTAFALKRFGGIDVLVNNAGIALCGLITDVGGEEWKRLIDVNVTGVFNTVKAVLPDMISKRKGNIINVSSVWGITGASCEAAYSASKAAVIGFTKALSREVGLSGIRVNCIAPGVVDTDMNAALTAADIAALKEKTPLNRIGSPRNIADAALFLASDGASFITGQVIAVDGGFI